MPVWQRLYEEINDPNFVIVCAAEDTGGEAVAGPIFDAARPTYIQIVDEDHIVSSAFNFVNVPSAAWIDEDGKIVRIDEGTYAKTHQIGEGRGAVLSGRNNEIFHRGCKNKDHAAHRKASGQDLPCFFNKSNSAYTRPELP